jgi:hypothetical protein
MPARAPRACGATNEVVVPLRIMPRDHAVGEWYRQRSKVVSPVEQAQELIGP